MSPQCMVWTLQYGMFVVEAGMGGFDAEWWPVSFVALGCGTAEGNVLSRIAYGRELDDSDTSPSTSLFANNSELGGRVIHVAHMGEFDVSVESLVPPFLRLSPVPEHAVDDLTQCWENMRGDRAVVTRLTIPPVPEEPSTVLIVYGVTQHEVRQVVLWCEEFGGHVGFSQGSLDLIDSKYVRYIHHDVATRAMFQQSIGMDWGERIPDTGDVHVFLGGDCPNELRGAARNGAVTSLPNAVAVVVRNCPEQVCCNAAAVLKDHKHIVFKDVATESAV